MTKIIKYSKNPALIDKNAPTDLRHYATGWENVTTSVSALVKSIHRGFAFAPQYEDGIRKGVNFICAQVIAADFDGTRSLDEIRNDPYINAYASFIYTTPSHTAERHRARAVFICDEPITKSADYANALLGLAQKLGSDHSVNDGARCFFGSSEAQVWEYPNRLTADQVAELIERGRRRRKMKSAHAPLGVGHAIEVDAVVRLPDGSSAALRDLPPKTSIHCPNHDDQNHSAFTVRSRSGSFGIHCKACNCTYFEGDAEEYDFYGFERLVEKRAANPQKKAVEAPSVFEEFFPAEPTCFVTRDRFLKPIVYKPGITLVKSPKGTGKTELLKQLVSDILYGRNLDHLKPKDRPKTILIIGHRRSLLREAARKLGVLYYLDVEDVLCRNPDTLAVCLDSLHAFTGSNVYSSIGSPKLQAGLPFDLVILDESEQLFAHSIGDTLAKKQGAIDRAYDCLQYQIGKAKAVIALDADLSLLTAQVLKCFRPHDWDHDTRIFHNQPVLPQTKRTLQLFEREVDLRDDLLSAIARGDRCFVACNSKRTVKVLDEIIRKRFGNGLKMKVITSDNSNESDEKEFVEDIANRFLEIQVLICSPSLGTGIDITFPDPNPDPEKRAEAGLCKVDGVYGFFSANVNTHTDMDQQLWRVRNPGTVKVWISPASFQYSTNFEVIRDDLARSRFVPRAVVGFSDDGQTQYRSEHPQLMIYSHVVAAQRSSKNRLIQAFCELRRKHGWEIETITSSRKKDLDRQEAEKVLWNEKVDGLLNAPVIDDGEYFDLVVRHSEEPLNARERFTYERNTLERVLGTPLSHGIICLNYDGRLIDRVAVRNALETHWDTLWDEAGRELEAARLPLARLPKMPAERLLCLVARVTGLAGPHGFDAEASIASEDLQGFADLCERNRTMIEEVLKRELRKDIQQNPVRQLGVLLSFCGLKLEKRGRLRIGGKPRRLYGLGRKTFAEMTSFADGFQAPEELLGKALERIAGLKAEWRPPEAAVPLAP